MFEINPLLNPYLYFYPFYVGKTKIGFIPNANEMAILAIKNNVIKS